VVAFVAFRGLTRDNEATKPPSVDWAISMKAGRADHQLQVLAPPSIPSGWRATSASYLPGAAPVWHLGMLTADTKYVGIEESRDSLGDLVAKHVDKDAEAGGEVRVGGAAWKVYTDSGGEYALGRTVTEAGKPPEAQLVHGSAPDAQIRDFTETLRGAPAAG
jgi:hypothetical protein